MLTLTLDSLDADGVLLQRNTLSFVELAAPEPKVGCGWGEAQPIVPPSRRPRLGVLTSCHHNPQCR
jgi:hypothetical protein